MHRKCHAYLTNPTVTGNAHCTLYTSRQETTNRITCRVLLTDNTTWWPKCKSLPQIECQCAEECPLTLHLSERERFVLLCVITTCSPHAAVIVTHSASYSHHSNIVPHAAIMVTHSTSYSHHSDTVPHAAIIVTHSALYSHHSNTVPHAAVIVTYIS